MSEGFKFQQPKVFISDDLGSRLSVDMTGLAAAMVRLGISSRTIHSTTIYFDNKNYLLNVGVTYPVLVARIRFFFNSDLHGSGEIVVRISSRVRGRERSEEAMNRTLVHELEHVAQIDRRDPSRIIGHLGMWGLAVGAGIFGSRLTVSGDRWRIVYALGFAIIGYGLGYLVAPHEAQARKRARSTGISVVKKMTD